MPREWAWRHAQRRLPDDLVLHFGDLVEHERDWVGPVPLTSPRRTIADCIEAHVPPDLVEQALHQARTRGLLNVADATELAARLDRTLRGAS